MTEIVLKIGGTKYIGWESVSIVRNMEELCGRFDLSLSDYAIEDTSQMIPGAEVKIAMQGDILEFPLMTGYIDHVLRTKNPEKNTLQIVGRDKTADIVDCSSYYKTSTWRKSTVSKIVSDLLEPYDVNVEMGDFTDETVEAFTILNSEKIFDTADRLGKAYGAWLTTTEDGNLMISSVGSEKADVKLEVGQNVKALAIGEMYENRYSEYIFRGQAGGGGDQWTKKNTQLKGLAFDADISRTRILILESEKKMTKVLIGKRAAWEAQMRASRSIQVNVEVQGWMQDTSAKISRPWRINQLAKVIDKSWKIDAELLVSGVEFRISEEEGRVTNLTLVPKEMFAANPSETIELSRTTSVRPR